MLGTMFLFWKMLDLSCTYFGFFVEINPNKNVDDWFRMAFVVFIAFNTICFLMNAYIIALQLQYLLQHNEGMKTAIEHEELFILRLQMDMAGMIAFIFEDMYGSILQMAALNLYDGTATITYLICVSLQLIEAGMSVTSFSDYQNTITAIQMAKLSAIESASASASEDTISEDHEKEPIMSPGVFKSLKEKLVFSEKSANVTISSKEAKELNKVLENDQHAKMKAQFL